MKLARVFILLILIFQSSVAKNSTGYAWGKIHLTPVASSKGGAVLFKTFYEMNPWGGTGDIPIVLGWLVVSTSGIWDEGAYVRLIPEGGQLDRADSAHLDEFYSPVDLRSPAAYIAPVCKKYSITEPLLLLNNGNDVTWTSTGIMKKNKVVLKNGSLRSIQGIKNHPGKGTPVTASFYQHGVALFSSSQTINDNEEEVTVGASYLQGTRLDNYGEIWNNAWISIYEIDGIAIIPEHK